MKQAGLPKKRNKSTQLTIDVDKLRSIFQRHSQILNEAAENWRNIAKYYFSLQWPSIKNVSQIKNFWKKYSYIGSQDAEKEDNEEVEEGFEIVSETFDNIESEEYDSRSPPDVL